MEHPIEQQEEQQQRPIDEHPMECPICLSEFEGESHVEICSNHCGFCESCLSMVFEHAIRNAMKKYNLEPDPSSSTTPNPV